MEWVFIIGGWLVVIDMVSKPESDWNYADREKTFWVILGVVLSPIIPTIYLLTIRPRFPRVGRAGLDSSKFAK